MAVTDEEEAEEAGFSDEVIAFTPDAPFVLGRRRPSVAGVGLHPGLGRPVERLTLDLGLRADWSRLLIAASQWSPRIGAAYRWPRSGTTLRASFGRFFQPPQPENVLLASSETARELSPFAELGGGSEIEPERQTALSRWASNSLSVDRARRCGLLAPAGDQMPPIQTCCSVRRWCFPTASPAAAHRASISGSKFRAAVGGLATPATRIRASSSPGRSPAACFSRTRLRRSAPAPGSFPITISVTSAPSARPRASPGRGSGVFQRRATRAARRWKPGTMTSTNSHERPGAEMVDFERGRVRPRDTRPHSRGAWVASGVGPSLDLDLRLSLLNLTGARWAYNFGNPFSGTHFGPGRTVQAGLRLALR